VFRVECRQSGEHQCACLPEAQQARSSRVHQPARQPAWKPAHACLWRQGLGAAFHQWAAGHCPHMLPLPPARLLLTGSAAAAAAAQAKQASDADNLRLALCQLAALTHCPPSARLHECRQVRAAPCRPGCAGGQASVRPLHTFGGPARQQVGLPEQRGGARAAAGLVLLLLPKQVEVIGVR
jgi:hypothetical protein